MTAEVENLMLEHLRAIRADTAKMAEDIRGLRTEMTSMRQHMAAVVRLDRIERRPELVD